MILDGLQKLETDFVAWHMAPRFRAAVRQATGREVPPLDQIAEDVPPRPAIVNQGRWLVPCPCRAMSYRWRSHALTFCGECGNKDAGGRWLRVAVPEDAAAIEAALDRRAEAHLKSWAPPETLRDLEEETEMLAGIGLAVPAERSG